MGTICSANNASKKAIDLNNTSFTSQELSVLRETYDTVKHGGQRRQLAQRSIDMVFIAIPEAKEKINEASRERANQGDDSNLMRRGMVFLDTIEKVLKVADDPLMVQDFIGKLAKSHIQRFGVDVFMMAQALDALKGIILPYIKMKHGHKSSLASQGSTGSGENKGVPKEENCKTCIVWERFFRYLRAVILSSATDM